MKQRDMVAMAIVSVWVLSWSLSKISETYDHHFFFKIKKSWTFEADTCPFPHALSQAQACDTAAKPWNVTALLNIFSQQVLCVYGRAFEE